MVKGSSRDAFLANLELLNRQVSASQERITSGLRVNRASDDPTGVADILRLTARIAGSERLQQDLGRVKAEVDSAENALQAAVSLMEKAITVASEGATTTNASRRPTLALQARGLLEQMVNLSRTTADGRYVFSGDSDQQPVYALENGLVERLMEPANTRLAPGPGGAELSVSKTAVELFDGAFTALQALGAALGSGDEAGIAAASDSLRSALDSLNQNLAFYGTAQNRIASATDLAAKYEAEWKVELSERRDTDVAETIVEMQTAQLHLQAAMQVEGQRPKTSLFDYLK